MPPRTEVKKEENIEEKKQTKKTSTKNSTKKATTGRKTTTKKETKTGTTKKTSTGTTKRKTTTTTKPSTKTVAKKSTGTKTKKLNEEELIPEMKKGTTKKATSTTKKTTSNTRKTTTKKVAQKGTGAEKKQVKKDTKKEPINDTTGSSEKVVKKELQDETDKKRDNETVYKAKNKKSKLKFLLLIVFVIIAYFVITYRGPLMNTVVNKGLVIESLSYNGNGEDIPYIQIKVPDLMINKELWCIATDTEKPPEFNENWKLVSNNICNVNIDGNDKYIFIRDKRNVSKPIKIEDYISCITKIETEKQEIKLIKDEEHELKINIKYIGNPDKSITISSENEEIAKIEGIKIIGVSDGITNIIIKDNYNNISKIKVQVTTLINLPKINNSRPFLKYKQYTEEEAKILDDYLFYQVAEAGKGTRAGAVAAARFLSLEFKYRVPYFLENGRLSVANKSGQYADGEGRYYHEGLYLSESKYADIQKRVAGPMMWGGRLREFSTDNGAIPNGLDCSGFISWCLKNGGFDFGDIGAGPDVGWPTLPDKGVSHKITMDLLNSHTVKAGDLIGKDGHIAIIIGVTDEHIYVADTLYYTRGTWVTEFTYKGLVNSYSFTHIYDMTEAYGEEGNYTAMWE